MTNDDTFDWIWDSSFSTWLKTEDPLFWISGNPASGKSTLMSHIARSTQTENILTGMLGDQWTLIHHFFDFRFGDGIGNNFEGLLRSLLFQLCRKYPAVVSGIVAAQNLFDLSFES